jgi:hypothetical protein
VADLFLHVLNRPSGLKGIVTRIVEVQIDAAGYGA